jgi:multidrug resistance efflux pump
MNTSPKAKPDLSTESGRSQGGGKFKRFFVLILGLTILGLAVVLSLWAWDLNERHPRTDDAVSRANIIGIAPRVSGPITKINVTDNQFVKGGDLLFEIDPADSECMCAERPQFWPRIGHKLIRSSSDVIFVLTTFFGASA